MVNSLLEISLIVFSIDKNKLDNDRACYVGQPEKSIEHCSHHNSKSENDEREEKRKKKLTNLILRKFEFVPIVRQRFGKICGLTGFIGKFGPFVKL